VVLRSIQSKPTRCKVSTQATSQNGACRLRPRFEPLWVVGGAVTVVSAADPPSCCNGGFTGWPKASVWGVPWTDPLVQVLPG